MMIPFEKHEIDGSIAQRFDKVVAQCPDRIAIKIPQASLTYREVDTLSNRIAWAIREQQSMDIEQIAVLSADPVLMIVALLGILKAGKCYVLLDPTLPQVKMLHILKDAQIGLIMATPQFIPLMANLMGEICPLINLDEASTYFPDEKLGVPFSPTSLATIFYTSGSTGQPKGVMRNHASLLHSAWRNSHNYRLSNKDSDSLLTMFGGFGWSATDIFGALLNGITLYLCHLKQTGLSQVLTWLRQNEITIFHPTVSVFRQILASLTKHDQFPKLRVLILGGDALYQHEVEEFRKFFAPDCRLLNRFGSTEAGGITELVIERDTLVSTQLIPVGYPVEDKEIVLFDDAWQKISVGNVGEIAIRSRYLSSGYWNDPELTRQKFLPDPEGGDKRIFLTGDLGRLRPDGCLEYLGRKDFMVKIRGYRVALTEIEAAFYAQETVKNAVVVAKERTEGEKFLVAYIVPATTPAPTVSALRQALAQTLPDYMLPSYFVFLDALPLTPTGKPDRQALPEPDYARPTLANQFVASRNDAEQRLAEIWAQTLGLDSVGIHDNFFELGGNSLLAGKVLSDIKQAFDRDLPMSALFHAPTIALLAARLKQPQDVSSFYSLIPIQPLGTLPPLFFVYPHGQRALHYSVQSAYQLSRHLGKEQPVYGLRYALAAIHDIDDLPETPLELDVLARQYIQDIQLIQPQGPYFLCGRSGGGIIAYEMACQLRKQNQSVAFTGLVDTFFPRLKSSSYPFHQRIYQRVMSYSIVNVWTRLRTSIYLYRQKGQTRLKALNNALRYAYKGWQRQRAKRRIPYTPVRYPGRVTLFEAEEQYQGRKAREGWEQFGIDDLEIMTVPGGHGNMMEEPANLAVMASKLQHCLQKARDSVNEKHSNLRLTQAPQEQGLTIETQHGVQAIKTVTQAFLKQYQLIGKQVAFGTDVVMYGIESDGWMQQEAVLELRPDANKQHMTIRVETHAPHAFYPVSLTFEDEQQRAIHTHIMTAPGMSDVCFTLPPEPLHYVKILCDKTFVPCQVNPNNSDRRELGVRLIGVCYA